VAAFENRQSVTAAKFINKSPLFILLLGVADQAGLLVNTEQKVKNIFVAPPYCQTPLLYAPFIVILKILLLSLRYLILLLQYSLLI
jgi:hypothetical protein